ncbi:MAG: phospholipid carrier-dependent glycosyltransferase [Novosphingobium sp.]|jgi:dolichyl-phosphate-mannose--protein O-mannosyl transferase|nr:phospholipid carrier-dependent glycosyltransferase [Novosphingobium sp.]
MEAAPRRETDPLAWTAGFALLFLALVWHRLGIPSQIYFDEVHYVPAARKLLQMVPANTEHPMLGKEIIAAAIALLGDRPLAWRVPPALFGAFGLFAFGRLMWWASLRRFATLAGMFLVATSFAWFIQSRIAMLDIFMAAFGMIALWQFAAALRLPARRARRRLALCGLCLGLALGAKWNIAPAAMLPSLTFLALRCNDHRLRAFTRSDTRPIPGIPLLEAAFWLGLMPLIVYWLTYLPAFFYPQNPVSPWDIVGHHRAMLELQDSVKKLHPYRSVWYEWVGNWRAIWYLYKAVDGAQRGVLLIGNPFTMLAGLPALAWCCWAGIRHRRADALAFALLYLVTLGMWLVSTKPIQFYYHYLLPGSFLMACLALALDEIWKKGGKWQWLPALSLAAAGAMFVWFYPIISSAGLHEGRASYVHWMWLHSWR